MNHSLNSSIQNAIELIEFVKSKIAKTKNFQAKLKISLGQNALFGKSGNLAKSDFSKMSAAAGLVACDSNTTIRKGAERLKGGS